MIIKPCYIYPVLVYSIQLELIQLFELQSGGDLREGPERAGFGSEARVDIVGHPEVTAPHGAGNYGNFEVISIFYRLHDDAWGQVCIPSN